MISRTRKPISASLMKINETDVCHSLSIQEYPDTGHKVFDSDTDLNYPPDDARFLNFLGYTVLSSMDYVTQLASVARTYLDIPDVHSEMLQLAFVAGQTDFSVLRKGKR